MLSASSSPRKPALYRRWSRPKPADPHHWTDQADREEHRHLLDAVMARDRDRADSVLRRLIGLTSGMVLDTEAHA